MFSSNQNLMKAFMKCPRPYKFSLYDKLLKKRDYTRMSITNSAANTKFLQVLGFI